MFKRTLLLAALAVFAAPTDPAHAGGKNVAIIDAGHQTPQTEGEEWCQFLTEHGHACTVFPKEGPTAPLDPFDVVIDMSDVWSDPSGTLGDCVRAGKTVITETDARLVHNLGDDGTESPAFAVAQRSLADEDPRTS